MKAPQPDDLVELGVLGKPKGLRGELWFRPYNPDGDALSVGSSARARLRDKSTRTLKVARVVAHGDGFLMEFEGVVERQHAEKLVGATLSVPRSELPPLEEGEYYHCDLPGITVTDTLGRIIGTIARVERYPTVDAIVVATAEGEREFPLAEGVLVRLDVSAREVVVDLSNFED